MSATQTAHNGGHILLYGTVPLFKLICDTAQEKRYKGPSEGSAKTVFGETKREIRLDDLRLK